MNDKNIINSTLAQEKLQLLQEELRRLGSVLVAFSGGVDSTFLLQVAHLTLGEKALAITARSGVVPQRDLRETEAFCAKYGIRHLYFDFDELAVPGFAENPPDRCYICKKTLFSNFLRIAKEHGAVLCEGSNMDDLGDYRPGLRALAELDVHSPLRVAQLSKAEIRLLSHELQLPTWDKPSFACLASRFVYGERITAEKLAAVIRRSSFCGSWALSSFACVCMAIWRVLRCCLTSCSVHWRSRCAALCTISCRSMALTM